MNLGEGLLLFLWFIDVQVHGRSRFYLWPAELN